jgi:hypothetical protein
LSARRAVGVLAAQCLLIGGLGAVGALSVAGTATAAVAATCHPMPVQPPGQQDLHGLKLSSNAIPVPSGLPCPDAGSGAGGAGNGGAGQVNPNAITPRMGGAVTDVFNAVHATSATDAWAVGDSPSPTVTSPLTEHWNGTSWATVTSP